MNSYDTLISTMQDDVLDLAKQIMQRPSITPEDAGCQALLKARLQKLGFDCEDIVIEGVTNLWARKGTQSPLLIFAGHTDVVPTGPLEDWASPPFDPQIRDGYLYGRGAADMKCAIAAMIIAVEQYYKNKANFPGSIGFLITSDEEGPSLYGTKKVIEMLTTRGEKIDYCLIGEPSSNERVGDQIRVGRRGSLHGYLTIHGKQGHVAHPHLAINPIHNSMEALHALSHLEWDQGNAHFPPTTFQITNIQSGTGAKNVIPGHLSVQFNLRFSPAKTLASLQAMATDILDRYQLSYDLSWELGAEPFLTKQGELTTNTQQVIEQITGYSPVLSTGGGTSDGRFIAPTGAQVVELGLSNATAHHVNECIKVDDLNLLCEIYLGILQKFNEQ